jgi:hypothetical protein
MSKHKCTGVVRSPLGTRLLELLATDRNHPEVIKMVKEMRGAVSAYDTLTDDEVKDRLEFVIASVPVRCAECDGTSD